MNWQTVTFLRGGQSCIARIGTSISEAGCVAPSIGCLGMALVGFASPMSMAGDLESLLESDSTLVTTDVTGDCIINRDDVAVALALRLDLSDVPDLDNDGMQTGADTILLIAEAIDNSLGDVDGDGRVDMNDLTELTPRLIPTICSEAVELPVNHWSDLSIQDENLPLAEHPGNTASSMSGRVHGSIP